MKNQLSYFITLARRWWWMVILGVVVCSATVFGISKITPRVYQATTTLNLNVGTSTSTYENLAASVQAVPTYAQLLTSSSVLNTVLEQHPGLTYGGLTAMITVKPQTNTTLIELDVENGDPHLAAELANEISVSFAQFVSEQLPATVQILPAQVPNEPIRPRVLQNTVIGALMGLGLGLALIVIFEWLDDRPKNLEEVQEMLGMETLTVIPWLSRGQRTKGVEEIPALTEGYRILATKMVVARKAAPFKLLMVASALKGEGKSSVATNLAYFLAMAGNQVLLVDADLRDPVLDQYFELEKWPELADPLSREWADVEVNMEGQSTDIPNLQVLTAGALPPNFMNMLQSQQGNRLLERFRKAPYDYIIFDTPPLLPVADAQILVSYAQALVLVFDPSKTSRKLLLRVKHLLDRMHTPVLGVVINKSRWPEHGEIRQYLKGARGHSTSTPAKTRPPEAPSVNGSKMQEVTVRLPHPQAKQGNQE